MTEVLQNLQVLIVEDTLTQAMMIQHVLGKVGVKSSIAKSAEKALKMLEESERQPDLILSDINMPEMSGYELCRQLKQTPDLSTIPFVLLSTLVDSEDLLHVIESGADNFIYKSFEGEYFIDRLEAIVKTIRAAELTTEAVPVSAILTVKGHEKTLVIDGQRLANLLVSSFEAAVSTSRATKG